MKIENVIEELKKGKHKPVYWLEGDEDFFIDEVMDFAEQKILSPTEAGFNLTTVYGRDSDWITVFNTCREYPMFGEKKVVLVKEAQAMRDIEKLETYISKPLSSTLLFVAYKGKKVDKRTKLYKTLKEHGVVVTTKKLYDNELPVWVHKQIISKGFSIVNKALYLLIDHIGNDLNRINNEIDKVVLNLAQRKEITENDIENFVGISKEYNVFELQDALCKKDLYKAIRIAQYFESNPKAVPLQLIFPALYGLFSKIQMIYTTPALNEKDLAQAISVPEWKIKEYTTAAGRYDASAIEKNLLLLHAYNLRNLGINDAGTNDGQLLKEMLVKMIRH
jgi:DNA polymerase-3 subunit delta